MGCQLFLERFSSKQISEMTERLYNEQVIDQKFCYGVRKWIYKSQ